MAGTIFLVVIVTFVLFLLVGGAMADCNATGAQIATFVAIVLFIDILIIFGVYMHERKHEYQFGQPTVASIRSESWQLS